MFLDMLNQAQRDAFIILAGRLAVSDGEDSVEELEALTALKHEMGISREVNMDEILAEIDVRAFDTHKSRVIASLELLRLAYADEYVHEAEIAEVRNVCEAMGFPEEWLTTMGEWATRFNEVEGEDVEGEMLEYKEALIQHAHQMMDM